MSEKLYHCHQEEENYGRLLITGASGNIGRAVTPVLVKHFTVGVVDTQVRDTSTTNFHADITNLPMLRNVFRKFTPQYILHLAANPNVRDTFKNIEAPNIKGTRNIYECAREAEVEKIVFASTTHLYGKYEGYPHTSPLARPIHPDDPRRPDSYYGVSKGFGEDLGRYFYDTYGIKTISIRIGHVLPEEQDRREQAEGTLYLSRRDVAQVMERALMSDIKFGTYFAISENPNNMFDIEPTKRELGYKPEG